jgi:hypothetical protein
VVNAVALGAAPNWRYTGDRRSLVPFGPYMAIGRQYPD